jgi:tetratricopeptide (TPR) repeat protein
MREKKGRKRGKAADKPQAVESPPPPAPRLLWTAPRFALEALPKARWVLAGLLLVGLLLRAAHLHALHASPFYTSLQLDARYYDAWAREIAGGAWIGRTAFWVDPLYAYVLGIAYRLVGPGLLVPRILNCAFGLATGLLAYHLALRVWESRLAAWLAALLSLLFVPNWFFEGQSEKTALTVVLLTAAVALFLRGSQRAIAAAGIVTGVAALARGNTLLYVPFAALCLYKEWDREPDAVSPGPGPGPRRAATFVACCLPVVALATLHNWFAAHEVVPTTTNVGINLYLGNHTGNQYGYYTAPDFLHPDTGGELRDFRAEGERRAGHALTDQELSTFWRHAAWEQIAEDPGLFAVRGLRKLALLSNDLEASDNEDIRMVADWSPVLRSPILWMGELIPLALLGLVVGRRRRAVRLVAAAVAIYVVSLLPFFVMARLRVQVAPLLAVLAAGGVTFLVGEIARRSWDRLPAACALVAVALVACHYRTGWMSQQSTASLAIAWNNLGSSLLDAGKRDDAIHAYERAVETDAAAVPASLRALGDLYRRQGDYQRAEGAMRRVLEMKPNSPMGREALRKLYAEMLADPRYRDNPEVRARAAAAGAAATPLSMTSQADPARAAMARARALGAEGRTAEAIQVLQEAVRRGPYDEGLHYALGETMERHATPAETIRFFSQELAHDEKPQTSHYFWASALARQGDLEGAIAQLQQALEIDPAHEMSQRLWGELLERQGKLAEALQHYAEAVRILPEYRAALEDAARVAEKLGRKSEAEDDRARAARADPNTPRRFLYWARYLFEKGRYQAASSELQRMLQVRPNDAEALALRDRLRSVLGEVKPAATGALAAPIRKALVGRLRQRSGAATWIRYDDRDPAASSLAKDLQAAFEEAGWTVRSVAPLTFGMKPGIYLLIAENPSETTRLVSDALEGAGLAPTVGASYRSFAEERRRANPNWRGVELSPDQEFAIVIGRKTGS